MNKKTQKYLKRIIKEEYSRLINESAYAVIKKAVNGKSDRVTIEKGKWRVDMVYNYSLDLTLYYNGEHIVTYRTMNDKVEIFETYNEDKYKKEIEQVKKALEKLDYPIK